MTIKEFYDLCASYGAEDFDLVCEDSKGRLFDATPDNAWINYMTKSVTVFDDDYIEESLEEDNREREDYYSTCD